MFARPMTLKEEQMKVSHLLSAGILATASALTLSVSTAYAAAPMVKTAAPGYYRTMLGDFEVTAISDGTVQLPVDKLLTNTTPAKVNQSTR
jgi:hypothetical protein